MEHGNKWYRNTEQLRFSSITSLRGEGGIFSIFQREHGNIGCFSRREHGNRHRGADLIKEVLCARHHKVTL